MHSPTTVLDDRSTDPFDASARVPVAGGELLVARAGPPPAAAPVTVLLIHGMGSSHTIYRTVVRELRRRSDAAVLAPDLRGRGRSAHLPPPYGLGVHAADLVAVLDDAGPRRVVLVGHSMGAYLAARLAAEQPERAGGLVLLDGGLPFAAAPTDPDIVIEAVVGPALERMHTRFASTDDYVASWRTHPALAPAWDADIEAYARYDMVSDADGVHCGVSEEAVRTDARDLLLDEATVTALDRVRAPVHLLRAPRGMNDDEIAMLPRPLVDIFRVGRPDIRFEEVEDVNHYTLVMGSSPGPARVAAAIEAVAAAAADAPS